MFIVFEGDVWEVSKWIEREFGDHETISLKDYFDGQSVWGVYKVGDEKFTYYYEFIGNGKYTIFVIKD